VSGAQEERSDVEEPAPLRMKTVAAPLTYGDCFFHAHKHHKKTPKQVTCLYPPKKALLHQVNGDQLEGEVCIGHSAATSSRARHHSHPRRGSTSRSVPHSRGRHHTPHSRRHHLSGDLPRHRRTPQRRRDRLINSNFC